MAQVTIKERIYVNGKGRRVEEDYKRGKTLAATPGDVVSEERAKELGVKASAPAEDKSLKGGSNKGGAGSGK